VAEELAMLDTLARGRLVVGLLRGTANEGLSYDLNRRSRREEPTDEGWSLILRAWTETQPFGWQGRHFQYRMVSIWPRPWQQPHPPTYALGTSARRAVCRPPHLGCGVSYGPFEVMAKATRPLPRACAAPTAGQPTPEADHIREHDVGHTDEEAHASCARSRTRRPSRCVPGVRPDGGS